MADKLALKMAIVKSRLEEAGWDLATLDNNISISGPGPVVIQTGPAGALDDLIVDFTGTGQTLSGFGGNDVLVGGAGADTLNGGAGSDTAAYVNASSGITLYMDQATNATFSAQANEGDARGDVFNSIEAVVGSRYGDFIQGTDSAERLWGWDGDDTLIGRGGFDKLFGGNGNDRLFAEDGYVDSQATPIAVGVAEELHGDAGNDTLFAGSQRDLLDGGTEVTVSIGSVSFAGDVVSYAMSNAGVSVNLASGAAFGGHAQGDTLIDIEAVSGSRFNDTLTGDNGRNILEGGGGNDLLTGGANVDVFWFSFDTIEGSPIGLGDDVITDWQTGSDKIHLDGITDLGLLNIEQSGADTLVTVDGWDVSIRVLNTNAATFSADVFA
jgi:Ca2+-binding RTX toxin-like protein